MLFLMQPHQMASRRRTPVITTRIATAAALLTFGLAGLGGTVVAIAAPAHADTTTVTHVDGTPMTGTAGPGRRRRRHHHPRTRGRHQGHQRRLRAHPRQRRHRTTPRLPPQHRPPRRPRRTRPQGQQRTPRQPLNRCASRAMPMRFGVSTCSGRQRTVNSSTDKKKPRGPVAPAWVQVSPSTADVHVTVSPDGSSAVTLSP